MVYLRLCSKACTFEKGKLNSMMGHWTTGMPLPAGLADRRARFLERLTFPDPRRFGRFDINDSWANLPGHGLEALAQPLHVGAGRVSRVNAILGQGTRGQAGGGDCCGSAAQKSTASQKCDK